MKDRIAYLDVLNSWLASITISCTDDGVCTVCFDDPRKVISKLSRRGLTVLKSSNHFLLRETKYQILEYLANKRTRFDLPLDIAGSDFQMRVWNETMKIPYGETISYSELASRIGNRMASRAVGSALSSNPTVILIPCHRVIRKSGELGGFGGKIHIKKMLLEHERRPIRR